MRVVKVLILALAALLMLSAAAYAADQLQTQDRLRGEDCVSSTTCATCLCPNPYCPNADCPGCTGGDCPGCDGPCASIGEEAVLSSADVGSDGSPAQTMTQARGGAQMKLQRQAGLRLQKQTRDCEECEGAQTQTRARTQSMTQTMIQTQTQTQTTSEELTQAQVQTQTQTQNQEQEQTQEQTQTGTGEGGSGSRGGN